MARYHVRADGYMGVCKAKTPENCPFAGEDGLRHFTDKAEAIKYSEERSRLTAVKPAPMRKTPYSKMSESQVLDVLEHAEDRFSEEYDDARTRLCQLAIEKAMGPLKRSAGIGEVFESVSEPDGGGTWDPRSGKSPTVGFCVSKFPDRSFVFDKVPSRDELFDALESFYDKNGDLLSHDQYYIGLWNDPKDGKVYLDVSERVYDAGQARAICKDNDQISFFDLQTFDSVTVDPNAKSGQ